MADVRTMFGAVMLVILASLFVVTLFSQSVVNGGYIDNGEFPLVAQSAGYMAQMNKSSVDLTNSMNTTLSQSNSIDLTGSFGATFFTAGAAMSIIWSSFMMTLSMFTTLIAAPILSSLGISGIIAAIGLAYVAGLILLIVAGVVFKWFV
jgi:hypothetical protein